MFGSLTEFGSSPFEFDEDNSDSFYVKLSTSFGDKTIWGVGLEDALNNSGCKVGDDVSVIHNGKVPVKVPIIRKDGSGNKVTVFITKERNSFVIKPKKNKVPFKKVGASSASQPLPKNNESTRQLGVMESIRDFIFMMVLIFLIFMAIAGICVNS
jgi:hypothetical protein